MAQDLEAWNILVIYLEQRNTALSDKCAGQGPISAVGDKTPLPWQCSNTGTERAHKARAGIISNLNHNLNMISLFSLCYSLVGFGEFVFYNLQTAWGFSLQFSASNTVRSSRNTCWTGFKYLFHSVVVAINLYLLFKQLHNSVPCLLCSPYRFTHLQSLIL